MNPSSPETPQDTTPAIVRDSATTIVKKTPSHDHAPVAQTAPDSWVSMPKRKPVPSAPAVAIAAAPSEPKEGWEPKSNSKGRNDLGSKWLPFLPYLQTKPRSRRFLLIGIVAAVMLIALIVGLAVGLTVGRKHSNLALPTSNGGPYEGDLTYYNPALGSCGYTNSDSDMVCAVSHVLFDAASTGTNSNDNLLCGMKLRLRRDGKSVDVKVVDRCVGCAETDLDVTEAVFKKVADLAQGRVDVEWAWLEKAPVSMS